MIVRRGPSPEAIQRINVALVILLECGPMRLNDWAHVSKAEGMSSNDHKSVVRRCKGSEMTRMDDDGKIALTQRGYLYAKREFDRQVRR